MGFTFVGLTLFLYLCIMKSGDIIDFDKIDILLPKDFRLCVNDWFCDADFELGQNWDFSFFLHEDGTAKIWAGIEENDVPEEEFYNKRFFYSGTLMGEYHTQCQCPTNERTHCERCGAFTSWERKQITN